MVRSVRGGGGVGGEGDTNTWGSHTQRRIHPQRRIHQQVTIIIQLHVHSVYIYKNRKSAVSVLSQGRKKMTLPSLVAGSSRPMVLGL